MIRDKISMVTKEKNKMVIRGSLKSSINFIGIDAELVFVLGWIPVSQLTSSAKPPHVL